MIYVSLKSDFFTIQKDRSHHFCFVDCRLQFFMEDDSPLRTIDSSLVTMIFNTGFKSASHGSKKYLETYFALTIKYPNHVGFDWKQDQKVWSFLPFLWPSLSSNCFMKANLPSVVITTRRPDFASSSRDSWCMRKYFAHFFITE